MLVIGAFLASKEVEKDDDEDDWGSTLYRAKHVVSRKRLPSKDFDQDNEEHEDEMKILARMSELPGKEYSVGSKVALPKTHLAAIVEGIQPF